MPIYAAMLRGINVGGNKIIKMDKLRASLEEIGLEEVRTYIQSGNVVFKASKLSTTALSRKIEESIVRNFGFSVNVICRTGDEISKTVAENPFVNEPGIDPERLHVAFLSAAPGANALEKLANLTRMPDRSGCVGKHVYLYLPNGVSKSSLWKTPLDGILSVTPPLVTGKP